MNLPLFIRKFFRRRVKNPEAYDRLRARYFGLRQGRIGGAVICPNQPHLRFHVELLDDSESPGTAEVLSVVLASRECWAGGGIPQGYGFDFEFPSHWQDGIPRKIRFRVSETGKIFPQSDKWLSHPVSPHREIAAALERLARTLNHQPTPSLNLVFVTHELHRTGAPIILLNFLRNASIIPQLHCTLISCGSEGDLEPVFRKHADLFIKPRNDSPENPSGFEQAIQTFLTRSNELIPTLGIINSLSSKSLAKPFKHSGIHCTWLIHEFPNAYPREAIDLMIDSAWQIVFPCRMVKDAFLALFDSATDIEASLVASSRQRLMTSRIQPQGVWSSKRDECPYHHRSTETMIASRSATGLPQDAFIVLLVGTVDPRKGADWVVQFVRWFRFQHPGVPARFIWLGKPTLPDFFEQICRDNELSGNGETLQFFGETTDVSVYYKAADVLLLASRLDPFPNVVLEALSFGLPFIGFDAGQGTAELLAAHDIGVLVRYQSFEETAQALIRYHEDSGLGAKQSLNAVEAVSSFSHEAHFRGVVESVISTLPVDHPGIAILNKVLRQAAEDAEGVTDDERPRPKLQKN